MRGFIITIVSISLIAILVVFSTVLHNSYLAMERVLSLPQPLMYTSFLFGNIADDVHSIVGPEYAQDITNVSLRIYVSDSLPKENFTQELADYEGFIEGELANATNSNISADFSGLAPDNMTMRLDGRYDYTIRDGDMSFRAPGGTGASAYDLTVTTNGLRDAITWFPFNDSGDMNVTVTYTDLNGTITRSGAVHSWMVNSFHADYAGGHNLHVTLGNVLGESGSLRIEPAGVECRYRFHADLPPLNESDRIGFSYGATLSYSQGDIGKISRIGN